jgi:hypothetical protein
MKLLDFICLTLFSFIFFRSCYFTIPSLHWKCPGKVWGGSVISSIKMQKRCSFLCQLADFHPKKVMSEIQTQTENPHVKLYSQFIEKKPYRWLKYISKERAQTENFCHLLITYFRSNICFQNFLIYR